MTWFRKLRSAIQIALVISIFWTTVLVLFRAGVGFSLDALTVAEFTDWFSSQIVESLAIGFLLGLLFAAGLVFSRRMNCAPPAAPSWFVPEAETRSLAPATPSSRS